MQQDDSLKTTLLLTSSKSLRSVHGATYPSSHISPTPSASVSYWSGFGRFMQLSQGLLPPGYKFVFNPSEAPSKSKSANLQGPDVPGLLHTKKGFFDVVTASPSSSVTVISAVYKSSAEGRFTEPLHVIVFPLPPFVTVWLSSISAV